MDRQALILYLGTVRDLEAMKYRINILWTSKKVRYEVYAQYRFTEATKPTERKVGIIRPVLMGLFYLIAVISDWRVIRRIIELAERSGFKEHSLLVQYFALAFVLSVAVLIAMLFLWGSIDDALITAHDNRTNAEKYRNDLRAARFNKSYDEIRTEEWNKQNSFYRGELTRINALLASFYAMDVIPGSYRDNSADENRSLAAACYLYDYMSFGQESLQRAFASDQMEDGIRRIEENLYEITNRIITAIDQQKVIREGNIQRLNDQAERDNRMLISLIRTESSPRNVEEYSRLAVYYNRAQALISMANYLMDWI